MVSLTSYTVRDTGDRMGRHLNSATVDKAVAGSETTVAADGVSILGLAEGTHDLLMSSDGDVADTSNGLADGTTGFGDASILATVGGDTLAAYRPAGSAPGGSTAGVATLGGPRLLFYLDNDPNAGNNGLNDVANLTSARSQALISAIDFATPLNAVPEPSMA